MSQANVELVRSGYEAFRRRDVPAIFALLDAEVEFYQSLEVPWGGLYKGHEEAREFFQKLTEAIEATVDVERFLDAGEQVVAIGHTRGAARASGKTFDVPLVHVWTVRDGRVTRFEAYIENSAMRAALET